jgi:hypothetical protein
MPNWEVLFSTRGFCTTFPAAKNKIFFIASRNCGMYRSARTAHKQPKEIEMAAKRRNDGSSAAE